VWGSVGGWREVWKSVMGEGGKNWQKIAWRTLWTAPYYISYTSPRSLLPVLSTLGSRSLRLSEQGLLLAHVPFAEFSHW